MPAIEKLLKPAQRQKIKTISERIEAVYQLPNKELGKQLIELSNEAWHDFEQVSAGSREIEAQKKSYFGVLVHALIPRLAIELGFDEFEADRSSSLGGVRAMLANDLRGFAANVIWNVSDHVMPHNSTDVPTAFELLTHEVANGNPVAIALDRLVKPSPALGQTDALANHVREISVRRGLVEQDCWTPAMQNYKGLAAEHVFGDYGDLTGAMDEVKRQLGDAADCGARM